VRHVLALQNPAEIFAEDVELQAYLRAESNEDDRSANRPATSEIEEKS